MSPGPHVTAESVGRETPIKDLIRNALVKIGRAGIFYEERVDPETGEVTSVVTNDLLPSRVRCREVSQDFGTDTLSGRRNQRITAWTFELGISFNVSANDEAFVGALLRMSCIHGYIDIRLQSKRAEHPAQQSADAGTQFVYTLTCTPRSL